MTDNRRGGCARRWVDVASSARSRLARGPPGDSYGRTIDLVRLRWQPRRVDPDFNPLASLWLAAVVALFAALIYAETWRTGKQLRRHRARLAGVGHGNYLDRTVETDTWQIRRDLAVGEVREMRRLRRLLRFSAVMTGVTILGITQVLNAAPIDPATLMSWGL